MNSMKIGTYQMDTTFGLYLPEYTIPAPAVQTNFVKIIGRDGSVDLSNALGLHYDSRTWSLDFKCFDPTVNWHTLSSQVMNAIHGKRLNFEFDDDPNYFWTGRVSVQNYVSNHGTGTLKVTIVSDPFKYAKLSTIVTKTASTGTDYTGSMVTFNDGLIYDLSADIEPIQDLHGYDHPWPAGGGVNKFDISFYNLDSGWTNVSGVITNTGTPLSSNWAGCGLSGRGTTTLLAGTYTLSLKARLVSGEYTAGKINVLRLHTNGANIKDFQKVSNPMISNEFQLYYGTLTLEESYTFEDINLQFSTGLSNAVFEIKEIQIELNTAPTAYSPYSNICPISGRTGVSVYDDPKHGGSIYWNQMLDAFTSSSNGTYYPFKNGEEIIAGNKYLTHVKRSTNSGRTAMGIYSNYTGSTVNIMQFIDIPANGDLDWYSINTASGYGISNGTSSGSPNMWVYRNGYTPVDTVTSVELFDLTKMFGAGNEPTIAEFQALFPKDSYPYNVGETTCVSAVNGDLYWKKDIDWSSHGTVYGGTLDVVSGVLTVDSVYFTDKWKNGGGATSLGSYTRRQFTHAGKSKYPNYAKTPICNVANYKAQFAEDSLHFYVNSAESGNIFVFLPNDTDGETDIQVCYELATPLTYQLTPQEVEALVGTNNVWSDGGNVTVAVVTPETLTNNGRAVVPTLTASADMVLKWGNYSASVQQGTSTIPQLILENGANLIYIIGTGSISFTWQEASL